MTRVENDRELLELAAKANWSEDLEDMSIRWGDLDGCILYIHADNQDHNGIDREFRWDPLNEDADAFVLAMRLELGVVCKREKDPYEKNRSVVTDPYRVGQLRIVEMHKGDPEAATRRAIVRAAAEIGRAMT